MESPSSASEDESGVAGASENHKDANSSTPSSSSKPASVRKDRLCPFCKQVFTSSSLGRHLDFFIRDKRPKLPDGVHDVDQIRKMRGAITRRHARTSAGLKREQQEHKNRSESVADVEAKTEAHSNSSSAHHTPNLLSHPPPPPPQQQQIQLQAHDAAHPPAQNHAPPNICEMSSLNRPSPSQNDTHHLASWTATGVINNLPPRMASGRFPRLLPRPDLQQPRPATSDADENDTARATELALRDVLDTLRQAITQETQKPIFDFDFLALSFPALCLSLLSPPPSLSSPFPMQTPSTWPTTGVPGRTQFEAGHEVIVGRLRALQAQSNTESQASAVMQPYFNHLNDAYRHWEAHSPPQQQNLWLLELVRTAAAERSSKMIIERRLEDLQHEVHSLRSQLEVAHQQHPLWPQNAPWPTATASRVASLAPLHMSSNTVQELIKSGIEAKSLDYESLISKWRPVAQTERRRPWPVSLPRTPTDSNVMPPLRSMSAAAHPPRNNSGSSAHTSPYTIPALKLVQEQSTYHQSRHGSARSSTQGEDIDAEYENEDEIMGDNDQTAQTQNIEQAERLHQHQAATVAGPAG